MAGAGGVLTAGIIGLITLLKDHGIDQGSDDSMARAVEDCRRDMSRTCTKKGASRGERRLFALLTLTFKIF